MSEDTRKLLEEFKAKLEKIARILKGEEAPNGQGA
jgi:hypothetical protein